MEIRAAAKISLCLQSQEPENFLTRWIARPLPEIEDLDKAYELYQELSSDLKDNPGVSGAV